MKYLILFTLSLLFFEYTEGKGPVKDTVDFDNIDKPVQLHAPIYLNKMPRKDTAFQKKYELQQQQTNAFYDTLKAWTDKNFFTQKIYYYVISPPSYKEKEEKIETERNVLNYFPFNNNYIKNITIKQLNVFGPTLEDTAKPPDSWVEKTANKIHVKTNKRMIKKHMVIGRGDRIDPYLIAENERIIRQLPYIQDARIIVESIENTDSVNLIVLTKDIWPLGVGGNIKSIDQYDFEVWHANIGGWGHEIENKLIYDGRESVRLGYNGSYLVNNIGGSFINSRFAYNNEFGTKFASINVYRDFYSLNTKYAGGIKTGIFQRDYSRQGLDLYKYYKYNIWLGRSFRLNKKALTKSADRIMTAGRVLNYNYTRRPQISPASDYNYHNRTLYLWNIGWSREWYYKSNLIYNFGRTEDIPCGNLIELTGGMEHNEFYQRPYTAMHFSKGNYINYIGYLRGSVSLGGFWRREQIEQGALKINTNFFSNLIIWNHVKFRTFFDIHYLKGMYRFDDEYISLNTSPGIEGLSSNSLRGNEKISLHAELACFTPFYFYGFRFVIFGSSDVGRIAPIGERLMKQRTYSAVSLGIRVRNERLAFKTFQLKVSYYPLIPDDGSVRFIEFSGIRYLKLNDFKISFPDIIAF